MAVSERSKIILVSVLTISERTNDARSYVIYAQIYAQI
jgi:hypothetical protein